jgi:histidinol phosphatase-like PHP family hydrolase
VTGSDAGPDLNSRIAAVLRAFAEIQPDAQRKRAYRRAAATILGLDEPVSSLVEPDGTLRKIPNIGPSSARVILELLTTGTSATVDAALATRGRSLPASDADARGDEAGRGFLSRAQVMAALRNRKLSGPRLLDYRGDLQMHSTWSDGVESIDQLAESCLARGYQYCGITDHSHGLPIAGGLSPERLARQRREIDRLNRQYAGRFRILRGVEANIDGEGQLDVGLAARRRLDLVIAAPHSRLRTGHDQTGRMLTVIDTPYVHVLAHARGRKHGSRPGIRADWDRVFRRAAERGVAIEIDGDPSRQDIDHLLARRALEAGCLFALDSDAHSSRELVYAETAIAHARLAGIPVERIVNCWSVEQLLQWTETLRP